jgi:hypothetical protein
MCVCVCLFVCLDVDQMGEFGQGTIMRGGSHAFVPLWLGCGVDGFGSCLSMCVYVCVSKSLSSVCLSFLALFLEVARSVLLTPRERGKK